MHTVTRLRRRWPKGTWMRLKSPELLRAFVGDPMKDASKRMSGRQLARYIDKHPSFIDHLLSGRRTSCEPETAEAIAEVLGVPLNVLFDPRVPTTGRQPVQQSAHARSTRAVESSAPRAARRTPVAA